MKKILITMAVFAVILVMVGCPANNDSDDNDNNSNNASSTSLYGRYKVIEGMGGQQPSAGGFEVYEIRNDGTIWRTMVEDEDGDGVEDDEMIMQGDSAYNHFEQVGTYNENDKTALVYTIHCTYSISGTTLTVLNNEPDHPYNGMQILKAVKMQH